jgi:hypothetical protein
MVHTSQVASVGGDAHNALSSGRHTPGPWALVRWDEPSEEALIQMGSDEPYEAAKWRWAGWIGLRCPEDAALIAASPCLLGALQQAAAELGGPSDGDWSTVRDDDYVQLRVRGGLLKAIQAAIAKAAPQVTTQPPQGHLADHPQTANPTPGTNKNP